MRRGFAFGAPAAAILGVALLVTLVVAARLPPPRPTGRREGRAAAVAPPPIPTLYCEFYNFMHNATVVSFLFAVEQPASGAARFAQMAVVEPDGTRTEFDAEGRPQWTQGRDDDAPTIASPDGTTRIVLYGFAPSRTGIFWTEAGVRSDSYKNLEGKCRQANFGSPRPSETHIDTT